MNALAVALAAVEIGTPLRRGPFALYPLFGEAPPAPPYRADAGSSSLLRVTELDDGADVNALQVEALGDVPLLLLAGELLLGNLQDRAVDVPVLVPAGRSVQVPVSCVEQGRWGDGRPSDRVGRVTPPAARARNLGAVARNVEHAGVVAGDQGMVWDAVEEYATPFSAEAPTRSLADVHRAMGPTALEGSSPLQGQRGVVATVGDSILGVDLFDRPDVLQAKWDAIVAGYALDAGVKSAGLRRRHVRSFLGSLARLPVSSAPGVGFGTTHHVADDSSAAVALEWEGSVVHLAAGTWTDAGSRRWFRP